MFRNLIPALAEGYHVPIMPGFPSFVPTVPNHTTWSRPTWLGFGFSDALDRKRFNYKFENLAKSIDRFTQTIGLQPYAIYVFKYWKEPTAEPGLTWFHCHQQLHMDFGFMALFDYV
jgi:hypothetical protein